MGEMKAASRSSGLGILADDLSTRNLGKPKKKIKKKQEGK